MEAAGLELDEPPTRWAHRTKLRTAAPRLGTRLLYEYDFGDGWCKGALADADGRVCMMGAVQEACGDVMGIELDKQAFSAFDYLVNALHLLYPDKDYSGIEHIADFNDDEDTGFDDVMTVFEFAIKYAQLTEDK